ncbi:MAG: DUF2235 domain-containing protein [Phycisphaerales bacterium]|nr:DUF2235 domain-containing protein [Phycisphaerales bacterium]
MPKNIVLCCDGTDNNIDGDSTNVRRLFACLENSSRQVTFYSPGVGTLEDSRATTALGRKSSRILDAAIGLTTRQKFLDMYEFLVRTHEEGDRIFLFGFSRGALAVRILSSALHALGLVRPEHINMAPYAWSILTGDRSPGESIFDVFGRFLKLFSTRPAPVHFMGVWDTVSSMGWFWDFAAVPFTSDNPSIAIVRHAVSIDERRAFFRSNLFRFSLDDRGKKSTIESPAGQDCKQVYFAGVHSDVGGGYPDEQGGLSKLALQWMMREAEDPGHGAFLLIDQAMKAEILGDTGKFSKPDPLAETHKSLTIGWWIGEMLPRRTWNSKAGKKRWRWPNFAKRRTVLPGSTIHWSVETRLADSTANYKPRNLPPLKDLNIEH